MVRFTDWDKECDLLKEWHFQMVEILTVEIQFRHPLQVLRLLKEEGIMFVNDGSNPKLSFEEWKATNF